MPTLHLRTPGTCTLVVDHGRPGTRSLGVPVGGAADRRSFLLGNALLGNPPETPALEIALSGPTLVADADLALVLVGAPFDLEAPGLPLRAGRTFTLPAGVPLAIRGTRTGVRAYLCVAGGIQASRVLDSATSLTPLRAGEELTVSQGATNGRFAELPLRIPGGEEVVLLRVLPGSHAEWFASMGEVFTVGAQSNRMGLRLQGEALDQKPDPSPGRLAVLASEPVCPGTVQVPRDGQPIVLGVDCQTIGGYPRLAQVIRADLDLLGQLRPGMRVQFVCVSLTEAEALDRAQREELRRWINRTTAASHRPAEV